MLPQQIIGLKAQGRELEPSELEAFLGAYAAGEVGDEQMAAMLMAIYFKGLSGRELETLVGAMLRSGRALDLSNLPGPKVDKHSTGGVGDNVSLVLAPLAAELGLFVPMMSGRGLGHTGGTLDKLEAIPGFQTQLSLRRFQEILASVGCAMMGQTEEIAPLDRRLYALRDVTATVASLPLITASIMSKKLAEGLDGLVLDVKVGAGALLPERQEAERLAKTMIAVGASHGLAVRATLSAMDRPLGRAIGNGLEVVEALACLAGEDIPGLTALSIHLCAEMAVVGGAASGYQEAREAAANALRSGSALDRFARLVEAQGGDVAFVKGVRTLPAAPHETVVKAERAGFLSEVEPRTLGFGLIALGGGRTRRGQRIDPRVGFELIAEVGDSVAVGQPLARVHASSGEGAEVGAVAVKDAFRITDADDSRPLPLILDTLGPAPA